MKKLLGILVLGLILAINVEAQETKKLPDISVYDQVIQESLEGKCGYSKRHEGPAAYIKCLNNQISGLNQLNSMPDISKLENWIQESLEGKCGYSKRHEGPVAYIRCLNGELASLNIKVPSIIIVKNESNETLKKTTNKEEKKKIVKEEEVKITAEEEAKIAAQKITQEEAINNYLSDRKLDPIEGIWKSVSSNKVLFKGEYDRIFLIYKKEDKFICKTIRSTKLSSGRDFCNLTKGSKYLYYETGSNLTFNLASTFNQISSNQCITTVVAPCASYVRIWPEVAGSSSSQSKSGSKTVFSSGTAFFVNNKGYIVTNFHVVEECNDQSKIMYKDKEYPAKLIASDKKLDLALLKAELKNSGYLKLSYNPKKMQKIYAAGYPFGKYLSDDLKFTDGIISSLKGFDDNTNQLQISAAINPGNSGGPVINQSGELIGVAVSGLDKEATEGINFAIKSEAVKTFLTANKVKPSSSFYSRELKNDKLLTILEEATVYTFCK